MAIHLRLVNQASDMAAPQVVVFRRLPDGGANEEPTAWLVVDDFHQGDEHRFSYDTGLGDPDTDAPAIWIAAVPEPTPDDPFDIDPGAAAELSLAGLASADVVMTGGGEKPFVFALEHAVKG